MVELDGENKLTVYYTIGWFWPTPHKRSLTRSNVVLYINMYKKDQSFKAKTDILFYLYTISYFVEIAKHLCIEWRQQKLAENFKS